MFGADYKPDAIIRKQRVAESQQTIPPSPEEITGQYPAVQKPEPGFFGKLWKKIRG